LPTILDVTATKTSWTFEGKSLATSCPSARERKVVSATGESSVMSGGFEILEARANHYSTVVSNFGSMREVAAVGESAELIGLKIDASIDAPEVQGWTLKQKKMFDDVSMTRGAKVPSLITGVITLKSSLEEGTEGIVAIDGIAAGIIGELSGASESVPYTAILDYSLLNKGKHTVELFLRYPNGDIAAVVTPG
jgi:hypothetical protein